MRLLASLLAIAALGVVVAARTESTPITHALVNCTVDASIDNQEYQFLLLINDFRRQHGVGPLQLSDRLNRAAAWKAKHMAQYNYFAHDDLPINRTWVQRLRDCGYTYNTYLGENIAAGNWSAQATFEQWRNSPPHRDNMLNPNYTAMGVGRFYWASSNSGWYWVTDFGGYRDGFTPPTPTPTPIPPTPTPTPTPTPLPPLPPASGIDSDGDGCDDAHEESLRADRGGLRDPNNPWDFFDTPDSGNYRDGSISMTDIFRVILRFGTTGNTDIGLFTAPAPGSAYHTAFDRSTPDGDNIYALNPADGTISMTDIFLVIAQFGHTCVIDP